MNSKWLVIIAGILLGGGLGKVCLFDWMAWTPLTAGLGIASCLAGSFDRYKRIALFLFAVVYGWSFICIAHDRFQHVNWREPRQEIFIDGEVDSIPVRSYSSWKFHLAICRLRSQEQDWQTAKGKVEVVLVTDELPPLIGDKILLKGKIRFPQKNQPGFEWQRNFLFWQGLSAQIQVKNIGQVVFTGWNIFSFPFRVLQLLREAAVIRTEKLFPYKQASVMKALLVGVRDADRKTQQIFTRTGTIQVLAMANRRILDSAFTSRYAATTFAKTY